MGYDVELEGAFEITPPLTAPQVTYLQTLTKTRRVRRDEAATATRPDPIREAAGLPLGPEGALFTGAGGMLGQEGGGPMFDPGGRSAAELGITDYNAPPFGQPSLWCPWSASNDGKKLEPAPDGGRVELPFEWLDYLCREVLARWQCSLSGVVTWGGEAEDDYGELRAGPDGVHDHQQGRPKFTLHRERCTRCRMSTPTGAVFCRGCRGAWSKHAAIADARMTEAADAMRAGRTADGLRLLTETLEALPWWATPLWERGRVLGMMGQPGAADMMAHALEREIDPVVRRGMRQALVRIHVQEGRAPSTRLESFRSAGRYAEGVEEARALEGLGRELKRIDLLMEGRVFLIRCTSGQGRDEQAYELVEEALQLATSPTLLELKGHLAFRLGHAAVGERALRQALVGAPSPRLWVELGVWMGNASRHGDAEECFDQALKLDAGWARAAFNKGHAALARGDARVAAQCFERASRDTRDPEAATLAARALADLRDPLGRGT